jgi:hypothetical protein
VIFTVLSVAMPVMISSIRRKTKRYRQGSRGDFSANNVKEFISPDSIQSIRLDPASLLGTMPAQSDCLKTQIVSKVNHLYKWSKLRLALTDEYLCFSTVDEENMKDKILLHEVVMIDGNNYNIFVS